MATRGKLTRSDFGQFSHEKGVRAHGGLFSITAFRRDGAKKPSLTCVVSKSVAQKAHDRNRIKRLCRESAHARTHEYAFPYSLVFRAKKESRDATFKQVDADIQFLLKKIAAQISIQST